MEARGKVPVRGLIFELDSNLITVRGMVLNLTVICQRCNVNLTEQVWRFVTPCRGETSEVCTRWGVLKLFIVRNLILNLTMIAFVDLPLYGRELVGDFDKK